MIRQLFPALSRSLLALCAAAGIASLLGAGSVSAEAPGTPIPTNVSAVDATTLRLYWMNTADAYSTGVGTNEGMVNFNVRYRVQGTPDRFESYTYVGGGGPPGDRGVWSNNPLGGAAWLNQILSYDATGLTPNTTYCFSVRAYAEEMPVFGSDYTALSPWSGERCAQTPPATLIIDEGAMHRFEAAQNKPPSDPKSATAPGLGAAIKPNPDLVAVSVNGPQVLQDGIAQTYQAVIRNDGSATTGMDVQINFSGSLEAWNLPQPAAADGMNCSEKQTATGTAFVCNGGSIGAAQLVTLQFQAHAAKAGTGDIAVVLNPNRSLQEMDYSNDIAVLHITVP
jgi:hypothetical protein